MNLNSNRERRIDNSINNMLVSVIGHIFVIVFGFVVRTIFINVLGIEYLGLSGFFINLLNLLSIANLGFDMAIIYTLYQPLANNDEKVIDEYMTLVKKGYFLIGISIFIIGVILIPVLPYILHTDFEFSYVIYVYGVYLINAVISYFTSYKHTILMADQKKYIVAKIKTITDIIMYLVQITIILWTKNFAIYVTIQIIALIIRNLITNHYVNKAYAYLTYKRKIDSQGKKQFSKNLKALFLYKLSYVVISGTDSVVISAFIGFLYVGLYANYLLLIATASVLLDFFFSAITASLGHFNVNEAIKRQMEIFNTIFFSSFWLYGISAIGLYILINPFIILWIGNDYLFTEIVVLVLVINFYMEGMQKAATLFRDTTDSFKKARYRPLVAAISNVVFSIIFVQIYGLVGVFLGTILSRIISYFSIDPYILFKYHFKKSSVTYFIQYFIYLMVLIIIGVGTKWLNDYLLIILNIQGILGFVFSAFIVFILVNLCFFVLFRRKSEYQYLKSVGIRYVNSVLPKIFKKGNKLNG